MRLGVARALNEIDAEHNRSTLKKAGFLTRDARVIESKNDDVVGALQVQQREGVVDLLLVQLVGEILLQRAAVDLPLAGLRILMSSSRRTVRS
jgi:hypothetical protein